MSFFRYPGGKKKLLRDILGKIVSESTGCNLYCEPFFGGGSVGTAILDSMPQFTAGRINDIDLGVASLWNAVIHHPGILRAMVFNFKPSVQAYDEYCYDLKQKPPEFKDGHDMVVYGFKKLVVHQLSYSGLGTMGGPQGGRDPNNYLGSVFVKYPISCRWSPAHIMRRITTLHNLFKGKVEHCSALSYKSFLEFTMELSLNVYPETTMVYLDPPYYQKGSVLYQHSFAAQDHTTLCDILRHAKFKWVLSYDDCEEIRNLYDWARITCVNLCYTIRAQKNRKTGRHEANKKTELIITPPQCKSKDWIARL